MFVLFDKKKNSRPIKVWLDKPESLEEKCYDQAANLSNLPFIHKWVSLMPDTHAGKGMPIGSVIATEGVIIPNAVGVDIGCGMIFAETSLKANLLRDTTTKSGSLLQLIIGDIMRDIPLGFAKHQSKQTSAVLNRFIEENKDDEHFDLLKDEIENAYYQVGTLGGGNHFIELQEDENGMLAIMLHSGSRHLGHTICKYFNEKATALNKKYYSSVPESYNLAFLPTNSALGNAYIKYMHLAMDYAYENRMAMLTKVEECLKKYVKKYCDIDITFSEALNRHHNYADLEHHYDKNVWVHRKGAIRARKDELGIIPGAMGSYSYIVKGLGNEDSFHSCSHGAGRQYSRKKALESFSVESVINDLKAKNVVLGKTSKKDVAEESIGAYKDIDFVIANERDLVVPVKKLKTVGVVKG